MPKRPEYQYCKDKKLYRKQIKNAEGKYISLYGKTPSELTSRIKEFQFELKCQKEDRTNMLVSDYAQMWFDLTCCGLEEATRDNYESTIRLHIIPYFEGMRMQDVNPADIEFAVNHVSKFSESVHNKTYMLLKQIFTYAYENADIPENPCPIMHNGGVASEEKEALSDQQVNTLLDSVKGTSAYLFCMIAVYTGMRREEIMGLKWDCVFLDDVPRIKVEQVVRHRHNQPVVSSTLKTPAARRTIPIPPQLVACLKEERDRYKKDEFVMRGHDGGPMTETQMRLMWKNVTRRMALPRTYKRYKNGTITIHSVTPSLGEKSKHGDCQYTLDFYVTPHLLRHTYITKLLSSGADIKTVQYLVGHKRSKTTLDIYAHLTYNTPEKLSRRVNEAFPEV